MIDEFSKYCVSKDVTILSAIKKMDEIGKKLLIVVEKDKFYSLLSIGDIQRAIIKYNQFDIKINSILRPDSKIKVAYKQDSFESIKKIMIRFRTEFMPVLNENKNITNIYFWNEIFSEELNVNRQDVNIPVVIMAGGKGTRLKPITNVLPKPLIPLGNQTIIEEIIDKFIEIGCDNYIISVNYMAENIKQYFDNIKDIKYKVSFIKEEKPLGTAGSLHLLKGKIDTAFFVSNCDIIIEEDYREIYKYHVENKNELTVVAALKHMSIPYGTIETNENGILSSLTEKPDLVFKVNSGMYILEPHLLNQIPNDEFFHITHLIEKINKRNGRVGVFPVSEKSWIDIGTWNEYLKNINIQ